MEELPPELAAKALRRELRTSQPEPKATAAQLGLAIASLTIGVLTACAAIPAGIGFHSAGETLVVLFAVLPFAIIAVVLGIVGRTSALGIAGLALGVVAVVETISISAYFDYKDTKEKLARLAEEEKQRLIEVERSKQEDLRRKANMESRIEAEANVDAEKLKLQREADERKAELEKERLKTDREVAFRKQQEAEAAARKAEEDRKADEERLKREAVQRKKDDEEAIRIAEEQKKATLADAQASLDLARKVLTEATRARQTLAEALAKAESSERIYKKQAESAQNQIRDLQRLQNRNSGNTSAERIDYQPQIEKLEEQSSRATKSASEANSDTWKISTALRSAQHDELQAQKAVQSWETKLTALGGDPNKIAAPGIELPPAVSTNFPVYVLIDGKKIVAKRVIDVDDSYAIQQPDGTTVTVPKKNVVEIKTFSK